MTKAIVATVQEFGDIGRTLQQIDITLRGKALTSALKKSGAPVVAKAKALCPIGGPRIKTKSGKKHLRDTITSASRDYGEVKVLVVGPAYPAGAHGHLVEFGTGERTRSDGSSSGSMPPHPFLRPAVESTMSQQKAAFETELAKHVAEASR